MGVFEGGGNDYCSLENRQVWDYGMKLIVLPPSVGASDRPTIYGRAVGNTLREFSK